MPEQPDQQERRKFLPSQFMRARRPELFSDTEATAQPLLDRATFEYHLDTLTSRKQEFEFEHFARKLAEKEICPNLSPQTGPTGGGDSKVDSETYPVSSEISERWYYGNASGQGGSTQRWAFAFSTKKDWKSKVRADIKAIASTERDYSVAYFITSRFVKDKDRAKIQGELRQTYGIDVRVLDRLWIVDKVFTNRREELAIDTLKLNIPLAPVSKKGPMDATREKELEELEEQINDPDRYRGIGYQLVEDAIHAALLARGLEQARVEVEGRLGRAFRLAEKHGTRQQQLACAYNEAWTYFWWYDDFVSFNKAFDAVEKLALGSPQVTDIELLQNLWQLLFASVKNGHIQHGDARFDERTTTLRKELQRLQKEQGRPSAALHATASLLLMDLLEAIGNVEKLKQVLNDFQSIFEKSKGLVNFPALQFIEILMELGEQFPDDAQFDKLFEAVLQVAKERESKVVSGRMLLRRGTQKLEGGRPYEAIRLLGRAQQQLALRESLGEMIAALALCANAYEAAGLLWAARGSLLVAANQGLREFWERGNITGQTLACLRRLVWIELQLGRVPCALAWLEVTMLMSSAAVHDEDRKKRLVEELTDVDRILGLLLLKTELSDLETLSFLPNVFERLGFHLSWMALLYALGYEDKLRSDKAIPAEESAEEILSLMNRWVTQPAAKDLPQRPEFLSKQTLELRSTVLGCDVIATVPNKNQSLFLAETVLTALEALLATSLSSTLLPHTSRLRLKFAPSDSIGKPLDFSVSTTPHTVIEIRYPSGDSAEVEASAAFRDRLAALVSTITGYMAFPLEGPDGFLNGALKNELDFGRSLMLAGLETVIGGILGDKPKLRISDWDPGQDEEVFPLRRKEPWNHMVSRDQPSPKSPTWGSGEPPPALFESDRLKHSDRRVFSLINIDLWNKAAWSGIGVIVPASPDEPPYLALLFRNQEAAVSIFKAWRDEIGQQDSEQKLRISIITGIDRDSPAAYRVVVGTNPDWSGVKPGGQVIVISRIQTMYPSDSTNLDQFLASYKQKGNYILLPARLMPNNSFAWAPELGILKGDLEVRPAWQIGEHDPDICGIGVDDKVIIPEGSTDPPILKALERIRAQRSGFDALGKT